MDNLKNLQNMDMQKIAEECLKALQETNSGLKQLNIMVIGKSGVGKSTLINSIFMKDFCETGVGAPITKNIKMITKPDYPLTIFDTPGFELSNEQQNKVKEEIKEIAKKGNDNWDENQIIHAIWYCVNVGSNRTFDDSEVEWIRSFADDETLKGIPLIVVLTQAVPRKKAKEMKESIERLNLNIKKVVPVLAQDLDFDEMGVYASYGLDTLVNVMSEIIPSDLQVSLQNAQRVSIEAKRKAARSVIRTTIGATFAEGFIPLPFSDAAAMIPTEVTMLAKITKIYGISVEKAFLTEFVSSTVGGVTSTVVGKTVVSNIIKLIPGAGTVVGGMISGGTAGMITKALGEAYIKVIEKVYSGEIKKDDIFSEYRQEEMKDEFKKELKKQK